MEGTRTNNAIRSTVTGLFTRIVMMVCPFIIRTIIIYKLGMEYAGLSSLFTSILQVLSLAELGFSAVVSFSMYQPIAEGNTEQVCALLSLLRKIYSIVGMIILGVGALLFPFLRFLINGAYPADVNLYILYAIYLFNTVVSYFISAYKSSLLLALQRADIENNLVTISNILMYVVQIVVLIVFPNYYLYIIFLPLCTVVNNLLRGYLCNKKFPQYQCRGNVSKEERRAIYSNIGAMVGHRISGIVVTSISNIIISSFLGLNSLAVYGNYNYITSSLLAIVGIVYSSITGVIGNGIQVNSREKNYQDFLVLTFLNVWCMGWMAICLVALYQPFVELWVGSENLLPFGTMLLFVAHFYLWRFKDILSTYKDACGMWKVDFWKPYAVIVVSLVISIAFINFIGINAVLIGSIAGVFVVSMPWETHVFFKNYFKKSEGKYYLRMLIYTLIVVAIAVANYFVCGLIRFGGIGGFALKLLISFSLPNIVIVLLAFRTREFQVIYTKLKELIFKRKKNLPKEEG